MRTEAEVTKLIEQHTELAKQITLYYVPKAVYRMDPDQWDSLALHGLWLAARSWDATKSKFNTYLTWKVRSLLCNQKDKNRRYLKRLRSLSETLPKRTQYTQEMDSRLVAVETSESQVAEVRAMLDKVTLTERQQEVLDLLFWQGIGPTEVAQRLGVTKQRVDALRCAVIQKLRRVRI